MGRPKRTVPIHNLRANHTSWTPPAIISFDTETVSEYDGDTEIMSLRLWCARFSDRRAPKRIAPLDDVADGLYAEDLAVQIHLWTRRRRTVWAYAHNLGFDLCTSDLVSHMVQLGWEVTEFAVSTGSPFVRMRRGDTSLTLSDSWSWLGTRLDDVAGALGMVKPPLPQPDDSKDEWLARCHADTNILHTAILDLMEWWDANDLGQWNITGSASGWNAMRHISSREEILIRPDETECDHDRKAIYGGRRTVWSTGQTRYGHYTEVDIIKAYTTVCRELPLPTGRQAQFASLAVGHKWVDCTRWGIIAQCTVNTDVATVPCRIDKTVWYPVGRFTTTLAGPDILECRKMGILESIGAGWLHKLGYALTPWATWCITSMEDTDTATPEVAKLVHRRWARTAVGKWAQRGFEVIDLGPSPNNGWCHEEAWHHDKQVPAHIVDFAGNRYQVAAVGQSDNAYPAILAFVESYVRVALNKAIDAIGDRNMVACDTDGYICDHVGASLTDTVNQTTAPLVLRQKRHYKRIRVIGPQHLELDQTVRRSGIPASAEMGADGKLHAHTWPKLAWQLANGRQGAYVRPDQAYTMAATYASGWVLTDGSVVPVEVTIGADGCNRIVPYPDTRYALSGCELAPDQNRNLERYRNG